MTTTPYIKSIHLTYDSAEKLRAIEQCSDAFNPPLIKINNFYALFNKINQNADFIIAEADSILGYAAIYANRPETGIAFITLICVAIPYQRRHIGQCLIEKCEQIAADRGFHTIRLEVRNNNYGAIQFYRKNNFVKTKQLDSSFLMEKTI